MSNYSKSHDATCDLHWRGYDEDFALCGDDLLWVQEKCFIREENFSITECYRLARPHDKNEGPHDIWRACSLPEPKEEF